MFKYLWTAVQNAFKLRWSLLVAAAFTIPFGYARVQTQFQCLPLIEPFWLALVLVLVVVASVFLLRLVALEKSLHPRITVCDPKISQAVMGPKGDVPNPAESFRFRSDYVHVVLENTSEVPVSNCSVHVMAVIKRLADGTHKRANVTAPISLISARDHQKAKTIHPRFPQHFDLAQARVVDNKFGFAQKISVPYAVEGFFADVADYDFDLKVTADNLSTIDATVRVSWSGQWDNMRVKLVPQKKS